MPRRSSVELPIPPDPFRGGYVSLREQVVRGLVDGLAGVDRKKTLEDRVLEDLREKCRRGNPFPLIAYQWPELLVLDPEEQPFFRDIPKHRLAKVTEGIRRAVLDPANPCLRLDWWQMVILAGFFDVTVGEIFVKGCTGAGKGASTGIAFCLWYDVYEESRITLSSRDYNHALTNIFGEVKQWFLRMKHPAPANVLGESIREHERHYVRILNPDPTSPTAGEAFSGAHGKNTIYGFDEATSAPTTFFENAEKNAKKIVALANPRTMSGHFREAFKPLGKDIDDIAICYGNLGNRLCVTVSGADCMNVRHRRLKGRTAPAGGIEIDGQRFEAGQEIPETLHKKIAPLIPSQIDLLQFTTICNKADPRLVGVFAYGRFPTEDPEKQIILRSWLDVSVAAYKQAVPAVEAFAIDVARSRDGDRSCLAAGGQNGVAALHYYQYDKIDVLCQQVLTVAREQYGIDLRACRNPIVVDCDGLGAGAADLLRAMGVWVIEFRGNATSKVDPRTYANLRAEAYGTLSRRLNPDDRWRETPFALPPDESLFEELTAPEKIYSAGDAMRFKITPKVAPAGQENVVSVKDKIGRSPDGADAVAYLFHAVRELHNLNEWFTQTQRPLLVYPSPAPPDAQEQPREKIDHSKPQPGDDPTLAFLREQYGSIFNGEATPPKPPTFPAPVDDRPQSWVHSIDWGD